MSNRRVSTRAVFVLVAKRRRPKARGFNPGETALMNPKSPCGAEEVFSATVSTIEARFQRPRFTCALNRASEFGWGVGPGLTWG